MKFSIKNFLDKCDKSTRNRGFGHICWRNSQWETSLFVQWGHRFRIKQMFSQNSHKHLRWRALQQSKVDKLLIKELSIFDFWEGTRYPSVNIPANQTKKRKKRNINSFPFSLLRDYLQISPLIWSKSKWINSLVFLIEKVV